MESYPYLKRGDAKRWLQNLWMAPCRNIGGMRRNKEQSGVSLQETEAF